MKIFGPLVSVEKVAGICKQVQNVIFRVALAIRTGEQNLNGIQPERPSSSQCTPPLSQPHSVVSEARFSHKGSDGLAFLGGLAW